MAQDVNNNMLSRVDIEEHINIDESMLAADAYTVKVCVDENKVFTDFAKAEMMRGFGNNTLVLTDVNLAKFTYQYIQGATSDTLAKTFNITKPNVNTIKCMPEFKKMLGVITGEVTNAAKMFLTTAGLKATRTVIDLLDSGDDKIRLAAAKDILDRMGVKTATQVNVNTDKKDDLSHMNEEQLKEILKLGVKELLAENKGD